MSHFVFLFLENVFCLFSCGIYHPWTARRSNQSILKEISPEYSLERLMLKLKLQYLACLNSCPLSPWCHPTISSSVIPFSSHLQSFPAAGSFSMSQLFTSGGQSIGASASASIVPMNIQDWFPLGLTGLILQYNKYNRHAKMELKVKVTTRKEFQNLMRQFEIIIGYS